MVNFAKFINFDFNKFHLNVFHNYCYCSYFYPRYRKSELLFVGFFTVLQFIICALLLQFCFRVQHLIKFLVFLSEFLLQNILIFEMYYLTLLFFLIFHKNFVFNIVMVFNHFNEFKLVVIKFFDR